MPVWVLLLFPVAFAGIWLLGARMLAVASGWNTHQDRYPDRADPPLLTLRFQSGMLGSFLGGVHYGGCMTLTATRTGLRVSVWRILAPFQSPFLVPWAEIDAAPARFLFVRVVRLRFGDRPHGVLRLRPRTWRRLVEASPMRDASLKPRA